MKKPNQIARKGDTARNGAQAKRRAIAPVKTNRKATRKPAASTIAPAEPDTPGKMLAEWEDGPCLVQALYLREEAYYLITRVRMFWDGRAWRTFDEWWPVSAATSQDLPGIMADQRWSHWEDSRKRVSRAEALAWLSEHHGETVIPEEFVHDLRPLTKIAAAEPDDVRAEFRFLVRELLKAGSDDTQRRFRIMAIMTVANALGFMEEALAAATIVNAHNASVDAETTLSCLADSGLNPCVAAL